MIFGFVEGGEVRVFDDIAHAMKEWGPYPEDVQSEVIIFYDSDGTWLRPIVTSEGGRLLGLTPGAKRFELVRDTARNDEVDPIWLAAFEASNLLPNSHVASIAELQARFPKVPPDNSLERSRES